MASSSHKDVLSFHRPTLKALLRFFHPIILLNEPIMAVTFGAATLSLIIVVGNGLQGHVNKTEIQLTLWLWATVFFAAYARLYAEQQGRVRALPLQSVRRELPARRVLKSLLGTESYEDVVSSVLLAGDIILVRAGETIPCDGLILEGVANVDESAITGESNPVIRESGGNRAFATAGTRLLSDWLKIRVADIPGKTVRDRVLALLLRTHRKKSSVDVTLNYILLAMTVFFAIIVGTLVVFAGVNPSLSPIIVMSLFISLIPTTIAGLMSAISIAGTNHLLSLNILSVSDKAAELAADVDVILFDKTGTLTLGNRTAIKFIPLPGVTRPRLLKAAYLSSLQDETIEGRSILALATSLLKRDVKEAKDPMLFIPFSAQSLLSGVDHKKYRIRKGALRAVTGALKEMYGEEAEVPSEALLEAHMRVAQEGGTPLVVAQNGTYLGVIHLRDVVKSTMRARISGCKGLGVRCVMLTGDNPTTAKIVAHEIGLRDVIAEATPEKKLAIIKEEQESGRIVGMCGDGTNDAPALAQADVALVMYNGTQTSREAANLIDLDSDPSKIIDIIKAGRKLSMTRGALTIFSLTNDMVKYFATIPALLAAIYPSLKSLDVLHLKSLESALLSTTIFNALVLLGFIPIATRRRVLRPKPAYKTLLRNLFTYGGTGLILPPVVIKMIDTLLVVLRLV